MEEGQLLAAVEEGRAAQAAVAAPAADGLDADAVEGHAVRGRELVHRPSGCYPGVRAAGGICCTPVRCSYGYSVTWFAYLGCEAG